ncbi:DapH/DapD/GlmU-related protein [Flavobacterium sp. DG2-3]|uniref:acyltransferase n=1 Tax=Flavobacterium sp. DG2-3 TaxID=3068317 RepID=UPI00273EEFC6|nr:acyltransferase [Flavobacterium sp. DG2-3]MDP5200715.1 acyltransferase [Flavobacterium sp. DG2-3]
MRKIKFFVSKSIGKYKLFKSKNISKKIFLGPNVQFFGIKNIIIKDNCTIGEYSNFVINNRTNNDIQLRIGKNVYLGRNNFITVGKLVQIGDYSIFGNNCSLIGAGKIFDDPMKPYAMSGISLEKSIFIGVNCWLGNDSSVIGNVRIGHGSIIGANTVVTKDVPPFSMVIGNPGKIVKTFNFTTNSWESENNESNNSKYFDENEYLIYLRSNAGDSFLAYSSASSRLGHL